MSKDLKLIAIGYPDKRVEDDLQPMLHTFTETLKLSKETTPILPPGVPDLWRTDMLSPQSQKALTTFHHLQAGMDVEVGPVDPLQFGSAPANQTPRFPGHFTDRKQAPSKATSDVGMPTGAENANMLTEYVKNKQAGDESAVFTPKKWKSIKIYEDSTHATEERQLDDIELDRSTFDGNPPQAQESTNACSASNVNAQAQVNAAVKVADAGPTPRWQEKTDQAWPVAVAKAKASNSLAALENMKDALAKEQAARLNAEAELTRLRAMAIAAEEAKQKEAQDLREEAERTAHLQQEDERRKTTAAQSRKEEDEEKESRRLRVEEEARCLMVAEKARRLEAEEARRLKVEEGARRLRQEESRRQSEEEEARRLKEATERAGLLKQKKESRQREEEEARRLKEEEEARRLKEAAERAALLKLEEESRLQREEKARRLKEEEEAGRLKEAAKRVALLKLEEENRRLRQEEACRLEEATKRAALSKLEEESRRQREEEVAHRLKEEEEARRLKEAAERTALLKLEEESRLQREEEARRLRLEEDARRQREADEARRQREEEERAVLLQLEEENRRLREAAEHTVRLRLEEENRRLREAAERAADEERQMRLDDEKRQREWAAMQREEQEMQRKEADFKRWLDQQDAGILTNPTALQMRLLAEDAAQAEARQRRQAELYELEQTLYQQQQATQLHAQAGPRWPAAEAHFQGRANIANIQQASAPIQLMQHPNTSAGYTSTYARVPVTVGPALFQQPIQQQGDFASISALGRNYRPGTPVTGRNVREDLQTEYLARPTSSLSSVSSTPSVSFMSSVSSVSSAAPASEAPASEFVGRNKGPNGGHKKMPDYFSDSRALINRGRHATWSISKAAWSLTAEDLDIKDALPGHIHFHTNTSERKAWAWMKDGSLEWEDITRKWRSDFTEDSENLMAQHPDFPDLRLTIDEHNRPNWIRFGTYLGRLKKGKTGEGSADGRAYFPPPQKVKRTK